MKNLKYTITCLVSALFFYSCDQGIDDITQVAPGKDATAPTVKINYPTEGTKIKVLDIVTSIIIDFEVTDDIEVASINVAIDNNNIQSFTSFKDYRRVLIDDLVFDNLVDGTHQLTITATDLEGKTTEASVNFEKEPAYTSLFAGETLYMPFDGDYVDLIGLQSAEKVGVPGFAGESVVGTNAYSGATDAYLEYPTDGLIDGAEFSASFWYKVDASPDRAGILVIGDDVDDRFQGIRLFREGNGAEQRIKANVGTGAGESWNDGAVINVADNEWVYITLAVSATKSTIFFNGIPVNTADLSAPVDWTNCNTVTIGAGGETFSYWDHKSDNSAIDELRFFNRALTASDIENMINVTNPYTGVYDGEMFYAPFDNDTKNKFTTQEATVIGLPGFADESVAGSNSFASTTDSYITYPTNDLLNSTEFSATFWYKVDANPDRAGILVIGDDADDRFQGLRLFREGSDTEQRIKANIGIGTDESWNDGDVINVADNEWVFVSLVISSTKSTIYFDGVAVNSTDLAAPIDWTGCDLITVGSGGETFSYWDHKSDNSSIDELRLYNKALSQEEIQSIRDADL
ncbi:MULTISPECIES: LamG domain-containing protein [unclassified Cellulophaga]|uniref:LamG domain-containing protein n=1 Tax=unclassified Cellulophaga TaxID=2634405 RepID=UPI0026E22AA2|nr:MULTISPECIES: LamG domain-containing protein [unclassified Cellulophaga]MDO6491318.1 LamG domain-containing protein [Cellulophaga sp. 2_MG-2023]MDO6495149.1 LamG domain-containing protein [Cellulophaga sp. 3_MG-2023]